jgi:hypothetical protein
MVLPVYRHNFCSTCALQVLYSGSQGCPATLVYLCTCVLSMKPLLQPLHVCPADSAEWSFRVSNTSPKYQASGNQQCTVHRHLPVLLTALLSACLAACRFCNMDLEGVHHIAQLPGLRQLTLHACLDFGPHHLERLLTTAVQGPALTVRLRDALARVLPRSEAAVVCDRVWAARGAGNTPYLLQVFSRHR